MKKMKITFALLLGIALLGGCKKYDDGPALSLKSKTKRLAQQWKLTKYFRNGNDETTQLIIGNYTEIYTKEGTHTRSYIDSDGDPFSETGAWQFDSKKMQIDINGVSSIEWTDQTSTVSASDYNILRLTSKELWYEYENGGDTHKVYLSTK